MRAGGAAAQLIPRPNSTPRRGKQMSALPHRSCNCREIEPPALQLSGAGGVASGAGGVASGARGDRALSSPRPPPPPAATQSRPSAPVPARRPVPVPSAGLVPILPFRTLPRVSQAPELPEGVGDQGGPRAVEAEGHHNSEVLEGVQSPGGLWQGQECRGWWGRGGCQMADSRHAAGRLGRCRGSVKQGKGASGRGETTAVRADGSVNLSNPREPTGLWPAVSAGGCVSGAVAGCCRVRVGFCRVCVGVGYDGYQPTARGCRLTAIIQEHPKAPGLDAFAVGA